MAWINLLTCVKFRTFLFFSLLLSININLVIYLILLFINTYITDSILLNADTIITFSIGLQYFLVNEAKEIPKKEKTKHVDKSRAIYCCVCSDFHSPFSSLEYLRKKISDLGGRRLSIPASASDKTVLVAVHKALQ